MNEPGNPRHLAELAEELAVLAKRLGAAAGDAGTDGAPPLGLLAAAPAGAHDLALFARHFYRLRRLRAQVFDAPELFGEPAWDMLLDLYVAAHADKRVSVTSACIGAAVPTTTALRWIGILEQRGLIVREADPEDGRRIFVRLTARGRALMDDYFSRLADPSEG